MERFWLAVKALDAVRCVCGREKRRKMAFCGLCYHLLPAQMQGDLYKRLGAGFEAAYAAATDWLVREDGE